MHCKLYETIKFIVVKNINSRVILAKSYHLIVVISFSHVLRKREMKIAIVPTTYSTV